MKYFKSVFLLSNLTFLFIGLLSLDTILPLQAKAIVEAKNVSAEVYQIEISLEEPIEGNTEIPAEDSIAEFEEVPLIDEVELPIVIDDNIKVAYLTFDDGPSSNITPLILDILFKENIQASFFVIGSLAEKHPDILLRMEAEGHFICNHTYTHNYKTIYKHPQSLIEELKRTDEILQEILGENHKSKIIRFPGGSFGKRHKPFRQAAEKEGYLIIDWNVLSGDAEGPNVSPEKQLDRIKETLQNKKKAVLLMHDSSTKKTTAEALPEIIDYLKSQGYVFKTLEGYEF